MLTLLHELYMTVKCFKTALNPVNSIDYMISNLSILFVYRSNYLSLGLSL